MRQLRSAAAFIIFFTTAFSSWAQANSSKPEIIGQKPDPMITMQGNAVTIRFENLEVKDAGPESKYPNGYSIDLNPGKNYRISQTTVYPDEHFFGTLEVKVRVDDGGSKSDWFDFEIEVQKNKNVAPRITGQSP